METVFTKDELARVITNWLYSEKPKDPKIKFVDCNGIELNGVEKIVVEVKK